MGVARRDFPQAKAFLKQAGGNLRQALGGLHQQMKALLEHGRTWHKVPKEPRFKAENGGIPAKFYIAMSILNTPFTREIVSEIIRRLCSGTTGKIGGDEILSLFDESLLLETRIEATKDFFAWVEREILPIFPEFRTSFQDPGTLFAGHTRKLVFPWIGTFGSV